MTRQPPPPAQTFSSSERKSRILGEQASRLQRFLATALSGLTLTLVSACSSEPTTAVTQQVNLDAGSAFSVSIGAPSVIPTTTSGRLVSAIAANGVAPYTFTWRQWYGGMPTRTETYVQNYNIGSWRVFATVPNQTLYIEVNVTDATGALVWAETNRPTSGVLMTQCEWRPLNPMYPPGYQSVAYGLVCGYPSGGPV
jgi:hypothetical protein